MRQTTPVPSITPTSWVRWTGGRVTTPVLRWGWPGTSCTRASKVTCLMASQVTCHHTCLQPLTSYCVTPVVPQLEVTPVPWCPWHSPWCTWHPRGRLRCHQPSPVAGASPLWPRSGRRQITVARHNFRLRWSLLGTNLIKTQNLLSCWFRIARSLC